MLAVHLGGEGGIMPTNRTRRARFQKPVTPLDETIIKFLLFGEDERGTPGGDLRRSRFFDGGAKLREVWAQHEVSLRAEWIKHKGRGQPWIERWNGGKDDTKNHGGA